MEHLKLSQNSMSLQLFYDIFNEPLLILIFGSLMILKLKILYRARKRSELSKMNLLLPQTEQPVISFRIPNDTRCTFKFRVTFVCDIANELLIHWVSMSNAFSTDFMCSARPIIKS